MSRTRWVIATACLLPLGLSGQESSSVFQLWLPDFFGAPFAGGRSVIELPDKPIQRLTVLIKDAQRRNFNPGRYRITVNGKGLGNVFDERTTNDGTLLDMDPLALRKRPDELFDPAENDIEVMGEDRRGRVYYQNWILRVNHDQNALFGYASVVSPADPNGVAPDLVVTEPALPPVMRASQKINVPIKGRVSSGARLTIDGQAVTQPKVAAITPFEYVATVNPGQREILLDAIDAKGNRREVRIPVYGPAPAKRPTFVGQKYAILIGVSHFGEEKDAPPPIPLAAPDVEEFAATLEKESGFKHENIRVLVDDHARAEPVRVALTEFASKAQASDLLVIYIATHGIHDPRLNRGNHLYFALNGTQIKTLDSTALGLEDLELYLNRSVRTNQAFLIFDVGHELNDDWRFRAGQSLVNTYVFNLFNDKPGWNVLVSGASGQTSDQHSGSGEASSLFSYWLLQGLNGAADLSGDYVITARELFSFVAEKVRQNSNGAQTPRFRVSDQTTGQPALRP